MMLVNIAAGARVGNAGLLSAHFPQAALRGCMAEVVFALALLDLPLAVESASVEWDANSATCKVCHEGENPRPRP